MTERELEIMSKRIDKKRMKRQAKITSAPRDMQASAAKETENIDFYIQYQGQEDVYKRQVMSYAVCLRTFRQIRSGSGRRTICG